MPAIQPFRPFVSYQPKMKSAIDILFVLLYDYRIMPFQNNEYWRHKTINQMDTLQLEYLTKIAELKSLSGAARFYNMPYQGIAREIDKLETELGSKLLTRSNKGCSLTEAGERVLEFGEKTLDGYHSLKKSLGETDEIRMGMDESYVHPKMIDFIAHNADAPVRLIPMKISDFAYNLELSRIDCFLGYANIFSKNIDYMPLSTDRLVVALSPRHPLSQMHLVSYGDLSHQTVFVGRFLWERRQAVINSIRQRASSCKVILEYTDFELFSKLFSGRAVVILPNYYLAMISSEVTTIPLENEVLEWGLYYNQPNTLINRLTVRLGESFSGEQRDAHQNELPQIT